MKRRTLIKGGIAGVSALYLSRLQAQGQMLFGGFNADTFRPTWDSLARYKVPDWFREAKFGIWAHWGPQCQPERGDWYARGMYIEGSDQYKYHNEKYGHPSTFGFKDVINEWKAEKWNPEELVALYKKAGAKYFVALANHHDNFDLYNSKHHQWNSLKMGPKKDIIGKWAKAAKNQGLHFGVSVHASHAWSWYETSQRADKSGPLAGVPYDGKLTVSEGNGKWWNGYDPQELYAQNHPLSENSDNNNAIHRQWGWSNGVTPPSKEYCENFYNRVIDLIDSYDPSLLYFDDTALPLWPVNDAGLRIAAHMYNRSIKKHGGLKAVINGKILNEEQRKCMVWDIERGQSNSIEPFPWQTDTCIGEWHYDRRVYNNDRYKTPQTVIHTLVDVVSKNGNLLLNVPLRGDGSMDEKERVVVDGITEWMRINSEAIYETRPWTTFGEGPASDSAAPLNAQGFNEGKVKFSAKDVRFVTKANVLYATVMGAPTENITVKSLRRSKEMGQVKKIEMLGSNEKVTWNQNEEYLEIEKPVTVPNNIAVVYKIYS